MSSEGKYLYVKSKTIHNLELKWYKLFLNEIVNIEAMSDYVKINMVKNNSHNEPYFKAWNPMNAFEKLLPKDQFERTSKFFIHNKKYKHGQN
jgi:DNA-binding LytR/AlgR family response regulator